MAHIKRIHNVQWLQCVALCAEILKWVFSTNDNDVMGDASSTVCCIPLLPGISTDSMTKELNASLNIQWFHPHRHTSMRPGSPISGHSELLHGEWVLRLFFLVCLWREHCTTLIVYWQYTECRNANNSESSCQYKLCVLLLVLYAFENVHQQSFSINLISLEILFELSINQHSVWRLIWSRTNTFVFNDDSSHLIPTSKPKMWSIGP